MDALNLPSGINIGLIPAQVNPAKSKSEEKTIQVKFTTVFKSAKQHDVASLVLEGCSNEQIAEKLNITVKTVKWHLTNIYKNEGVTSRSEYIVKKYKEAIVVYGAIT